VKHNQKYGRADTEPDFESQVGRLLERLSARLRIRSAINGVLACLAVLSSAVIAWSVTFLLFHSPPPEWLAITFWGLALGGAIIPVVQYTLPALFYPPSGRRLAMMVEDRFPTLGGRLLAAVELENRSDPKSSSFLRKLNLVQVGKLLRDLNLEELVPAGETVFWFRTLGIALAVGLLLELAAPFEFFRGLDHLAAFFQGRESKTTTRLAVYPGDKSLTRPGEVDIIAAVTPPGTDPPILLLDRPGEPRSAVAMKPLHPAESGSDAGLYHYLVQGLVQPIEYQVTANGVASRKFSITMLDRPSITEFEFEIKYPAYTGKPASRYKSRSGDLTVLRGSWVRVRIRTDKPLEYAEYVFGDSTRLKLNVSGNAAGAAWRIWKSGVYAARLKDTDGLHNSTPAWHRIEAVADDPPELLVESPAGDYQPGDDMVVLVSASASDDWGVESLWLEYSVSGREVKDSLFSPIPADHSRELTWRFDWDLSSLDIRPGDKVECRLAVRDNDRLSGPKTTYSPPIIISLPGIEEIFRQADQAAAEEISNLSAVREETDKIRRLLDDIRREISARKKPGWEKKQDLKSSLDRLQELSQTASYTARKLQENLENTSKSGRMAQEIVEKMMQLQRVLSQVLSREILEKLEKLSRQIDKLSPEELTRQITDLEKEQEKFLERLNRSLALLNELRRYRELQFLQQALDDLARNQESLLDTTLATRDRETLKSFAPEQDRLRKQLSFLGQKAGEISDSLLVVDRAAGDSLRNISAGLKTGPAASAMEKSTRSLQAGDREQALVHEDTAAKNLRSLAERLKTASAEMRNRMSGELLSRVDRLGADLLRLSFEQEAINNEPSPPASDPRRQSRLSDRQGAVKDGIRAAGQEFRKLSHRSLFLEQRVLDRLSQALAQAQRAAQSYNQGKIKDARMRGRMVLSALNQALAVLYKDKNEMARATSAMGLEQALQQLESLAGSQAGVNRRTSKLADALGNGQGSLSLSERAMFERLARDQSFIKKNLEELEKQLQEKERLLGDLDSIGRDMEEVIRDLQDRGVTSETINKQKRILSRLLDAGKSLTQRDYSPRRKSETAGEHRRSSRPVAKSGERPGVQSIWSEMTRALNDKYPPEYEPIIRAYFRSLAKWSEERQGEEK